MSIRIETDRLILRQFKISDAEPLHAICSQQYILKWMSDWAVSLDMRKQWIAWVNDQCEQSTKDTARVMLAVTLKDSNTLIGMVGIGNKSEVDNEIEIAYFISEEYSGKGYMTEAARAMSDWTLHTLDADHLIAIVEPDNIPSQRVIEKCGFKKLGERMILNSGEEQEKLFYYYRLYG